MVKSAFNNTKMVNYKELTEGCFNAAYDIKLDDGRSVILKVSPLKSIKVLSYEKDIMKAEVEAMILVKKNTDVPVPEVLFSDFTHNLCDADYFFMEKVEGESYSSIKEKMADDEKFKIEFQIGQINKKINSITNDKFGYFAQKDNQRSEWKETFLDMIRGLLSDAENIGTELPMSRAEIEKMIEKNSNVLLDVTVQKLVHWDLWDGNVFVKNGAITGIIDFERCMWGDPLMEYFFGEMADSKGFKEGYGEELSSDELKQRRMLYDLYLDLTMYIECDFRKYEDEGYRKWTRDKLTNRLKLLA